MAALLCLAFFLSGMAGLLFESLWFYQAGLGLGNSVWASSLVLASFMGGLGVGNGLIGRFGHRVRAPVRLYAFLEIAIGAGGVALVYLLPLLTPLLVPVLHAAFDSPLSLNAIRVGVSFALLVLPASAMGATMPLLVAALCRRGPRFGAALGRLYGWNTLGAVVGASIGELWLFGWLGIRGSAWAAACTNASAALLALLLSRRLESGSAGSAEGRAADHAPALASGRVRMLLLAAFVSGAALLALEVIWFRFLLLVAAGTSRSFAIMLATVLAGIALGGLAAGRWLRRDADAFRQLPALAALGGVLCIVSYAAFGSLPRSFEGRSALFGFEMLEIALPLMLPVSLVSGALFTLLGEALHREAPGETRAAGLLTLTNTLGAMLGSLLAGFVLLPGMGIERATVLLAGVYALLVALLWSAGARPEAGLRSRRLAAALVGLCLSLAFFPHGLMLREYVQYPIRRFEPDWRPSEIREGLTETIVYLHHDLFGEPIAYRMLTNSHSMASTIARDARYMKLFVYWPVAVHPDPRSALLISYGVGVTAKALTDTRSLEHIDFVDVSRDVFELNRNVYANPSQSPLNDPRVTVHVEDGRFFLETTDRRYDLITGEPPPPKLAGIVTLYTREYFELMRSRLTAGGIATYWLPVHNLLVSDAEAILAAFCAVFPDCTLWQGSGLDWMMAGTNGATGPVSADRFREQWEDPVVGPEMRALGFESPEAFGALFIEGSESLRARTRRVEPLTDDRPKRLSGLAMQESPRFLGWLDGNRSRREFRRDPTVARLWPRELIDAAGAAFEDEVRFERSLARSAPISEQMPQVHRFLTRHPRTTAPLWMLDSGWSEVEAARRAVRRGESGADLDYHLGVADLVERDFGGAAREFRRAASARPAARYLETYALGLAGRWDEARKLERALRSGGSPADPAFDAFLRELLRGRGR